jgi:hypothetical protein
MLKEEHTNSLTSFHFLHCLYDCTGRGVPWVYRVIHKSLRDFRPVRYSSRDGHAEGEHVNRGRDTPSFCPTLQVLDMSTLGDAEDVNPVIKFLPHTVKHVASGARVYVPLTPRDLPQLRQRMVKAVAALDLQMLQRVCGRNLIAGLTSAPSPRVDVSSTCKLGQKLGVSLPLLTCSPSA